jgi:hypothetical protein
MMCYGVTRLQEEELKAAIDKAVEAETRTSEAEIRMKEMKVNLTPGALPVFTADFVFQHTTTLQSSAKL